MLCCKLLREKRVVYICLFVLITRIKGSVLSPELCTIFLFEQTTCNISQSELKPNYFAWQSFANKLPTTISFLKIRSSPNQDTPVHRHSPI